MKVIFCFAFLLLILACQQPINTQLDFLLGTWKVEGREQYEVWEKGGKEELKGHGFKMKSQQKHITETLVIRKQHEQWVYEATVPDQNEGKSIAFVLKVEGDSLYSFENPRHDFPQKIQYRILDARRLEVMVSADSQGFSYRLVKQ
jgi:hypothetical protein